MTLTRPAWHATLTNHTRDWSFETYQDEEIDPLAIVRLLDDWSATWGHRNTQQWEHLEPSVGVAKIGVANVDDMPQVEYDDEMSLVVVRPQAVGDPIVWFHVFGGVTDLDAATDTETGAALTITFVDPHATVDAKPYEVGAVGTKFGESFGIGIIETEIINDYITFGDETGFIPEGITAGEFVDRVTNDMFADDDTWITWRTAHRVDAAPGHPTWELNGDPGEFKYRFYLEPWPVPQLAAGDGMPTLLTLGVAAGILTATSFDSDELAAPMTVLDADAIHAPVPWKKDATSGRAVVEVTGYTIADEEQTVLVGDISTQEKVTNLALPTLLIDGLDDAGEHRLGLHVESDAWRAPSMTVNTSKLDDDQVDYLADGRLFPRQYPYDYAAGMPPVVVAGAAPQSNLSGALIIGVPIGATFRLTGGKLLVDLDVAPWALRAGNVAANVPGVTYAALNTAFPAIDYAHVDPSLTYDDLKLAAI